MTTISNAHADILILISAAGDAFKDGDFEDAQILAFMAWQRAIREGMTDIRKQAYATFRKYGWEALQASA